MKEYRINEKQLEKIKNIQNMMSGTIPILSNELGYLIEDIESQEDESK